MKQPLGNPGRFNEAGVVIRSDGQVVTAYAKSGFKSRVVQILRDVKAICG